MSPALIPTNQRKEPMDKKFIIYLAVGLVIWVVIADLIRIFFDVQVPMYVSAIVGFIWTTAYQVYEIIYKRKKPSEKDTFKYTDTSN